MRTTCPFVEKFFVDVETHYLPDAGTQVCSINSGGGKATPNIYGTPSFYNYCKETTVDITSKSPGEENVGGGGVSVVGWVYPSSSIIVGGVYCTCTCCETEHFWTKLYRSAYPISDLMLK